MARYAFKSNVNDGGVLSHDASVAAAQAGSNLIVQVDPNLIRAGQHNPPGDHLYVFQGFLEYTHTPAPTSELVTNAAFVLEGLRHTPTGDSWALEIRERDWGTTVETGDFVSGTAITANTHLANYSGIRTQRPAPAWWRAGSAALRARVSGAAALRVMLNSSKQWLAYGAGGNGDEYVDVGTSEAGVNAWRPRLEYQTTRLTSLTRVEGASAQLSDGTHVYLDADTPGSVLLKHNPSGTTYNTVATLSVGVAENQFKLRDGAQCFGLCVDSVDNIYVVGANGSIVNGLAVQGFTKGVGHAWTAGAVDSGTLPSYDGDINQITLTAHSTSWLVAAVGHAQGELFSNQTVLAAINATLARSAVAAPVAFETTRDVSTARFGAPVDATGHGMDILALSSTMGVLALAACDGPSAEAAAILRTYRYGINSTGGFTASPTSGTSGQTGSFTLDTTTPVDGDARVKIVPSGASRFCVFALGAVQVFSFVTADFFRTAISASLTDQGLTSVANNRTQPWDAVWDPAAGKLRVYYLDTANSRRLMRTGYTAATNLWDKVETQVATNLGAAGSSHLSIRLPRGSTDERRILVHLGNKTGGGVLSTVTQADTGANVAPNTPVLTNPGTFNAVAAKAFSWTFSDPNPDDFQSAYEVEIRDQSSLVMMYDPGKVTSSVSSFTLAGGVLSNTETYEWRVLVYDQSDTVSAWTAWQAFSTVATGIALITSPATDNLAGLASPTLTITWTFTASGGLTQTDYRVKVIRVDTGAQVFDSGFISGPDASSYTITGLLSIVVQRIELTVEDSGGNISNTATRLVTPQFSNPDQPTITAQPNTDGSGVLVTVTNPGPTGDLPAAGRNDIYRSLANADKYIKVGETTVNGQFTDYGAASGVAYDYKVAAVADGQTFSLVVEDITTSFLGVYLHDPTDAVNTLRHFMYGGASKSDEVSAKGTELRFLGRGYPVFEFGDQLGETVKVAITVPFSATWATDMAYLRELAQSRKTWCYRDGRGRKVFGVVASANSKDTVEGTGVDLTVTRVEFIEGLP